MAVQEEGDSQKPLLQGEATVVGDEKLVELATEHCELAHGYAIPRDHVLATARPGHDL